MPGLNHVHKYRRAIGRITNKNRNSKMINYYKCALKNCTHYVLATLILGKESICNRCGNKFTLPMALSELTNSPHCRECTKRKSSIKKEIEDGIDQEIEMAEHGH